MKALLSHLQAAYPTIKEVIPDEKVHRFAATEDDEELLGCYVAFQRFSPKTGEAFFVAVYWDWKTGADKKDFCSLEKVTPAERPIIRQTMNKATKIIKDFSSGFFQQVSENIAEMTGVPEPEKERQAVIALGFSDGSYFYTSSQNQQIVEITKFSQSDFLKLMTLNYWETAFPSTGPNGRVDWQAAMSNMMDQARKRGIFQHHHVRGTGVWNDAGRVVVNMGDHLIVDGEVSAMDQIKSRYFYTIGKRLNEIHPEPLTVDECGLLLEICEKFKWRQKDFGRLLAGGLVVSKICGALPVRPHIWLTGGAQTGKSTLLEKLVHPMIGSMALYFQGGTTEAGIRQSLRAMAVPIMFDEFESSSRRSAETVASIVELLRSSWSDNAAHIAKGSSGGTATAYQARFSAIVSSIRPNLTTDADRSRFAILELAPHGNDETHYGQLKLLLDKLDEEYVDRLFARTIAMIPTLLENHKRLKAALAAKASQRFGDQYGMLMAGLSILLSDDPIEPEMIKWIVESIELVDEKEEAKVADHDDCLNAMLSRRIRVGDLDKTVLQAIIDARHDPADKSKLEQYGISVDDDYAYVSNTSEELRRKVFDNTNWADGRWAKSLLRLDGASKTKYRFLGRYIHATKLPKRHIL